MDFDARRGTEDQPPPVQHGGWDVGCPGSILGRTRHAKEAGRPGSLEPKAG